MGSQANPGPALLWILVPLIGAAAVVACGSKVSSSGPAWEGGPTWEDYCEGRRARCDGAGDACEEQEPCGRALLRDDIEGAFFQCLSTTCDADTCVANIINQFSPTPMGEQFRAAHQAYLASCPEGNDDVATAAWIVTDDLLDEFQACVEAPSCAEADACFDQLDATRISVCQDWL